MAKSDNNDIVRPSVLDRLMKRPEGQSERIYYEGVGVRELKEAVARDLERLLNTRMWLPPSADDLNGLDESQSRAHDKHDPRHGRHGVNPGCAEGSIEPGTARSWTAIRMRER